MKEKKRLIGWEGEKHLGLSPWPIYEILCPECGKWSKEYGEMDVRDENNESVSVCNKCAAKLEAEYAASN